MVEQLRLERFEALLASLEQELHVTERQLVDLTAAGKQKSATFKQLLARKLTLSQFLAEFEKHDLR